MESLQLSRQVILLIIQTASTMAAIKDVAERVISLNGKMQVVLLHLQAHTREQGLLEYKGQDQILPDI